MPQNIGTTVTAPLVKNDSLDEYEAVHTNVVKGGPKVFATLAELYAVGLYERDWGMIGTVYNDGSNTGKYELLYNLSSTDKADNGNWQAYTPGIERPIRQILVSDAVVNVPPPGYYAVVHYNIEEDTTPTAFPAATGSGKTYHVFNINGVADDFAGWITLQNINGVDEDLAPGNSIKIYDYGVGDYLKI